MQITWDESYGPHECTYAEVGSRGWMPACISGEARTSPDGPVVRFRIEVADGVAGPTSISIASSDGRPFDPSGTELRLTEVVRHVVAEHLYVSQDPTDEADVGIVWPADEELLAEVLRQAPRKNNTERGEAFLARIAVAWVDGYEGAVGWEAVSRLTSRARNRCFVYRREAMAAGMFTTSGRLSAKARRLAWNRSFLEGD